MKKLFLALGLGLCSFGIFAQESASSVTVQICQSNYTSATVTEGDARELVRHYAQDGHSVSFAPYTIAGVIANNYGSYNNGNLIMFKGQANSIMVIQSDDANYYVSGYSLSAICQGTTAVKLAAQNGTEQSINNSTATTISATNIPFGTEAAIYFTGTNSNGVIMQNFTVTLSPVPGSLPGITLTTDINNPVLYLIKNTRSSKYVKFDGQEATLKQSDLTGGNYDAAQLWYFMSGGDNTAFTQRVRIFPYVDHANVGRFDPNSESATYNHTSTANDQTVWYVDLRKHPKGGQSGYFISESKSLSDDHSWNAYNASHVGYWNGNDAGSKWLFEAADADKVAAAVTAYAPTLPVYYSTDEHKVYYAIKDVRSGKYVKPHSGDKADLVESYMDAENDGLYDLNCVWYFTSPASATGNPAFEPVRIYNYPNEYNLSAIGTSAFSETEKAWYIDIFTHTKDETTGHVISPSANGEDGGCWNNFRGDGTQVSTYSGNDQGSKYEFEVLDGDVMALSIANFEHNYSGVINHYKELGNGLASTPLASAEAREAWNRILAENTGSTEATFNAIYGAYQDLLDAMNDGHANFAPFKVQGDRMTSNDGTTVGRYDTDVNTNKTTWTLVKTGDGFKLLNEYYQQYLRHPQRGDSGFGAATLSDEEHASVYVFEVYNAETGFYCIRTLDTDVVEYSKNNTEAYDGSGNAQDYCYLHSNTHQYFEAWSRGDNSSWKIEVVGADVAALDYLSAVVANYGNYTVPTLGTGLCEYGDPHNTAAPYNAAKAAATSAQAAGNDAQTRREAARNLIVAKNALDIHINLPVKGGFYRIKNTNGNKYLKGELVNNSHHIVMEAKGSNADAFNANRAFIWLYDESGHLICMDNGKVLGTFAGNDSHASHSLFVAGETNASGGVTLREATYANTSGVHISTSGNRWIYGADNYVMAGDDNAYTAAYANTGYTWIFEKVEWLPVAAEKGQFTAFKSPLPLDLRGQAEAYTATIEQGKVRKLPLTDKNTLPANTPVLLDVKSGVSGNAIWPHVNWNGVNFVTGTNANKTASALENNEINVSYLAVNKPANAHSLIDGRFAAATGDVLNGFVGYVIVTDEDFTDEIDYPYHQYPAVYNDGTISHQNGGVLSHSHHHLDFTLTPYDEASQENQGEREAPMRRVINQNTESGVYTLTYDHVKIEDGEATLDCAGVTPGAYTLNLPAEFFLVDGTHYTPALTTVLGVTKDGTTTGIDEVMVGISEGAIYDLQGRRLAAPVKGINIIGGRKVLIK